MCILQKHAVFELSLGSAVYKMQLSNPDTNMSLAYTLSLCFWKKDPDCILLQIEPVSKRSQPQRQSNGVYMSSLQNDVMYF